jgi:hypothetical protein
MRQFSTTIRENPAMVLTLPVRCCHEAQGCSNAVLIAAHRSACEACAPRVHGTMFEGERFDGRGLNYERLSEQRVARRIA